MTETMWWDHHKESHSVGSLRLGKQTLRQLSYARVPGTIHPIGLRCAVLGAIVDPQVAHQNVGPAIGQCDVGRSADTVVRTGHDCDAARDPSYRIGATPILTRTR